ncbi:sugar ABC transporter ATP-binding protein [Phocoenobacter skyensis]|uniref:Ribose transport system ATP-binding protein n=1 Tax=Phocoenobacter skyensis TaxID=97481 RepID=A0A1H7WY36_9PAST|nr:sugar ABC transporter ATP-binding protein [Pasteurella skyensis]MDP8079278.1 sugar ABC transporter ATP-binding protein [Pasteurella skyensis]MDP8085501.1 sugar ABC transporter ATP-binding protein [Pasteurella skyensis]MDP8185144.1 sugar ABC transporter ATP-binding protein [Pasteurella skyensis]QLB21980.1 ribonucleotide-diphosphate reductase subunit alpha [Pasteurella skyensis]SEM26550.1 ribose transport system ATP-binding protein [Pasteurella skyensis]
MLEMKNITKCFPGVTALSNVSLTLKPGEIHAIVGENGAGKSTLMKVLNGVYKASEGNILIDGKIVTPQGTRDAQKLGINIIFQEFSLIPYLNAVENIFLGREMTIGGILNKRKMQEIAQQTLNNINVSIPLNVPITHLSVAEQQFVEIAKALAFDCKYLVLDEPTATLTPTEAGKLLSVMRKLKEKNIGCFYISHHLEEVFEISDCISCLRDGEYIGTFPTANISEDEIITHMVGRSLEHSYPPKRTQDLTQNPIALDVKKLIDINGNENSFKFHIGEIVGIAGLVGSGRTEMCKAIVGAYPYKYKDVYLDGELINFTHPAEALAQGVGYLSEDRKKHGLFLNSSVKDNITISSLKSLLNKSYFVSRKKMEEKSLEYVKQLSIKTPSINKIVSELSGGNQQKVIIARWLLTRSRLLFFDEPTRGIDVGAKLEIYNTIQTLANSGISVVVISSDLPEIVGISDRVFVMREGKITANLVGDDINPETIMQYSTGGK